MATFHMRGTKWQVQVRRKHNQPMTRTSLQQADAREWGRLIEQQMDRHELAPNRDALDTTTLHDVIRRYQIERVPHKKGAKDEAIVLTAFLRQRLCQKPLSQLT